MSYKDLKGGILGVDISKKISNIFRTPAFRTAIESINKFTDFLSNKNRIYEFENKMLYFTKFSTKINSNNEDEKNIFYSNYIDFIKDFTEKYEKIINSLTKVITKYNEKTIYIDYKFFTKNILLEMDKFDKNINNVIDNVSNKNGSLPVNGENRVINEPFLSTPIIAQPLQNYVQQYPAYGEPADGEQIYKRNGQQYGKTNFGGKRHRKNQTRRHTNRRKRSHRHH